MHTIRWIHIYKNRADSPSRKLSDDPLRHVHRPDAEMLTRKDTKLDEPACRLIDPLIELSPGPAQVELREHHGILIGVKAGRAPQHAANGLIPYPGLRLFRCSIHGMNALLPPVPDDLPELERLVPCAMIQSSFNRKRTRPTWANVSRQTHGCPHGPRRKPAQPH